MVRHFLIINFLLFLSLSLNAEERIVFEHQEASLAGVYLPQLNHDEAKAVILFVHGDGPLAYDAEGYYEFVWQSLRQLGYAIFSWDKAGVGSSSGNWLNQSMLDRQSEVNTAIQFIQSKYGYTKETTGLLGFSQAGWVLPAIAAQSNDIGFMIGIGFATNWKQQGRYYSKVKHTLANKTSTEIESELANYEQDFSFLKTQPSYDEYVKGDDKQTMSPERYQFVLKNMNADASKEYSKVSIPSLFMWGEDDLNVDAKHEFELLGDVENTWLTLSLIPNASHGMLDSTVFNTQTFGLTQWLKMMWYEEDSLAHDFLPELVQWLEVGRFKLDRLEVDKQNVNHKAEH
ncbi:hypothetical protein MED121_04683 [Marinomonas sp. MED121]|uniref:alpha/beta hydrolase family protein n=1 Tax=Marinomonas sp. MED121 TaxID=314277 RepID=UPI00006901D1|nr:alpha/beta hydrolase [Marinomonas sp. MED121]EAQ64386.1 hypothetical protein MED121_04683 [Marinomonas sp. MED121]